MPTKGILYGVSVGPGDPELMTLKAVKTIAACPVIAAPQTTGEKMLALKIAQGAVDLTGKQVVPLFFSMAKDQRVLMKHYEEHASKLKDFLLRGMNVAMLNLGDVSVYSTFSRLMELLERDGYETRMIPGVPSFCAVAARLQTSLTATNLPLHIYSGQSEGLHQALALPGTKVLMKSGRQIDQVCAALKDAGRADCSMAVQDCGLPTEKVCHRLEEIDPNASYFTTILVKG